MSKKTVKELVADQNFEEKVYTLRVFTNRNKQQDVKKVCPICEQVFDKFLHCLGPLIGCTRCALQEAAKRGIHANPELVDTVVKVLKTDIDQ